MRRGLPVIAGLGPARPLPQRAVDSADAPAPRCSCARTRAWARSTGLRSSARRPALPWPAAEAVGRPEVVALPAAWDDGGVVWRRRHAACVPTRSWRSACAATAGAGCTLEPRAAGHRAGWPHALAWRQAVLAGASGPAGLSARSMSPQRPASQAAIDCRCNMRCHPVTLLCGRAKWQHTDVGARQILIVEDERPIREMIAFGLSRAGFEVREAEDCRSGARRSLPTSRPT